MDGFQNWVDGFCGLLTILGATVLFVALILALLLKISRDNKQPRKK